MSQKEAYEFLKEISGEDFGMDIELWALWVEEQDYPPKVRGKENESEFCLVHGVRLTRTEAFTSGADLTPTDARLEISRKYPWMLDISVSLKMDKYHTEPTKIKYCPQCQRSASVELKKKK